MTQRQLQALTQKLSKEHSDMEFGMKLVSPGELTALRACMAGTASVVWMVEVLKIRWNGDSRVNTKQQWFQAN